MQSPQVVLKGAAQWLNVAWMRAVNWVTKRHKTFNLGFVLIRDLVTVSPKDLDAVVSEWVV